MKETKPQQNCVTHSLKIPFFHPEAHITDSIIELIHKNQQQIDIDGINVSRKRLIRQLHEAQVVKYRNKETGEIIERVENSKLILFGYNYLRMADFKVLRQNSDGKAENTRDSQQNIADLAKILRDKIIDGKKIQMELDVIPQAFLRPYNLSVPSTDLLNNRLDQKKGYIPIRSQSISFGEDIPQKAFDLRSQPSSNFHKKLVECFKMRPCWLRNTLQYYLWENGFKGKYTNTELKNSIKYICFTFKDGPWKHTLCRYGFDPSLTPESAQYQVLLVKIKQKDLQHYESSSGEGVQQEEEVPYDPTFKEIPTKFLRLYQIGDIKDDRIQERLEGVKLSSKTCSKQFGWLSKKQYQQLFRIAKLIKEEKMN